MQVTFSEGVGVGQPNPIWVKNQLFYRCFVSLFLFEKHYSYKCSVTSYFILIVAIIHFTSAELFGQKYP